MSVPPNQVRLLSVNFANLTTSEAADRIEEFIHERSPRMVLSRNAAVRVMEDGNPSLRRIYENSDLVTVDGMAFVYLSRLLRSPFKEMTGGPSLWYELLRRASLKGYRVFLLGAKQEILEKAIAKLSETYPGLIVCGHQNGYYDPMEEGRIVEAIRDAKTDILMVGMSSPLKEEFLERNLSKLGVPVCAGIGGAIDVFAGLYRLAPGWMRKSCLEWLYRAYQEPRRLAIRYLVTNSLFIFLLLREALGTSVPAINRRDIRTDD